MSKRSEEIIKQFGNDLVRDIKKAIPVATGRTRDSVRIEFRKNGFDIYVGAQVGAIINGRKPTSPGAVAGTPTLQQEILQWMRAKSITPRESNMTIESLSWAISKSIHQKGYPGKGNIFKDVLTKSRLDALTKALFKDKLLSIDSDIIKDIKAI